MGCMEKTRRTIGTANFGVADVQSQVTVSLIKKLVTHYFVILSGAPVLSGRLPLAVATGKNGIGLYAYRDGDFSLERFTTQSMYRCLRVAGDGLKKAPASGWLRECRRGIVTDADVVQARNYCSNQLKHGDYEAYLIRQFVPRSAQDAYNAFRTLNLELARLPETVSNPTIGRLRLQFWRDTIDRVFAGNPPREPIAILLYSAIAELKVRAGDGSASSIKFWLMRFLKTREKHMENRPFVSLASLEDYSENTYATLIYMTLASIPLQSVHMDHLASHIGKACGIVATLRGIPVLAAPSQPIQGPAGANLGNTRSPALLLPLDVMAESNLKEEDVFRMGPSAEGLQDAVFQVATRANDHLITAREMLKNLRLGQGPDHDYEHEGEPEHVYPSVAQSVETAGVDIQRGFGVLIEAIAAEDYLKRLEGANFDPFRVKKSWKLPWSLWKALKNQQI